MSTHLFPLTTGMDNYVRKIWYAKSGPAAPLLYLETMVEVHDLLKKAKAMRAPVLTFILKASALTLKEYPQMYHYCFDGTMVSGGEHIRITSVHELANGAAASPVYLSPENKKIDTLSEEIAENQVLLNRTIGMPLNYTQHILNKYPRIAYFFQKIIGTYNRNYMRDVAPFFITAVNMPGIYRTIIQPFDSPCLMFNRALDGKAVLGLSLNHSYGNARQIGIFLNRIRSYLENPVELL